MIDYINVKWHDVKLVFNTGTLKQYTYYATYPIKDTSHPDSAMLFQYETGECIIASNSGYMRLLYKNYIPELIENI